MKKIYLIIILVFISITILCQDISVNLSIVWDYPDIEVPSDFANIIGDEIPYLKIKYLNTSERKVYFLKLVRNRKNLPFILDHNYGLSGVLTHEEIISRLNETNCSECQILVTIEGAGFYNSVWYVSEDKKCIDTLPDCLVGLLSDIYSVVKSNNDIEFDTINPLETYFRNQDIELESLRNNTSNRFVFLNEKEEYSERFNLIGFYLLGGKYTFALPLAESNQIIFIEEDDQPILFKEIELPNFVDEYSIYSGYFKINSECNLLIEK